MSPQESSRTQGNFEGQSLLYTQPEPQLPATRLRTNVPG